MLAAANMIYTDLSREELTQHALANHEGVLSKDGALTVSTGKRTGRSPKDRFIVKDAQTSSTVDWGAVNQPMVPATFHALWHKAEEYLAKLPHYVSHLRVGADDE